jgi:hypothetical protein
MTIGQAKPAAPPKPLKPLQDLGGAGGFACPRNTRPTMPLPRLTLPRVARVYQHLPSDHIDDVRGETRRPRLAWHR